MSIIDTSSLVQNSVESAELSSHNENYASRVSGFRLPKISSALVSGLKSKLEKLKMGVVVFTAAAAPFISGCSKTEPLSAASAAGPSEPSVISQSILPIATDTKISLEQSVKIAQSLSSLSSDLKVVYKDIQGALNMENSGTNVVEKADGKDKAIALGNLERSSQIALLGTEQALRSVPTNSTFNTLQLALKQVGAEAKAPSTNFVKVMQDSSTTVSTVGKALSEIIERLGPAEHVVQLMDIQLGAQSAHKEISAAMALLSGTNVAVTLAEYPKVQKAGHEAAYAAKVLGGAATNSFFAPLAAELKDVSAGLSSFASNTMTYASVTNAVASPMRLAKFNTDTSLTLGKLSVLYNKVGEELSSLGQLGVIQMMSAPSSGVVSTNGVAGGVAKGGTSAPAAVANTSHSHPVFFYHTYWRPWYGGYYYDGPSHYSSGLWSGYRSSKSGNFSRGGSSSAHASPSSSAPHPSATANNIVSAATAKPGTFGFAKQGVFSQSAGFASGGGHSEGGHFGGSAGTSGAHAEGGHASGSAGGKAGGSSSSAHGSSSGLSGSHGTSSGGSHSSGGGSHSSGGFGHSSGGHGGGFGG